MASMTIRTAVPDDAAPILAVTDPIDLTAFATPRSFRAMLERETPENTERLVVEVDDAIVAWAPSGAHKDGGGWFWIGVGSAYRNRGIGRELYERIETRVRALGASVLRTQINDEDGRRFLEHRRFERSNVLQLQALDLQSADLPEAPASVSLRELDVLSLCALYLEGHADIPSRAPRAEVTAEEFRREVADSQTLDRDASAVLLEDGEPVAFSLVVSNRDQARAGAQLTTVRRDRRGRGLAQAVKVASLHRARSLGLRTMLTANDLENEAMLTVNRKLGFEPSILLEDYEKAL